MQRSYVAMIAVLIVLCACLQKPAVTLAADPPKFDSPAAVMSAAEDAFVNRDFATFADCFDADGQKKMNENAIGLLSVIASLGGDSAKASKAMLTQFGLTDLSKKGDESDDQFNERLAGQLKDPRGFLAAATPLVNADTYTKKPPKGTLADLKIDGTQATGTFVIHVSPNYTMSQDVTFTQKEGSWKISKEVLFPAPVLVKD